MHTRTAEYIGAQHQSYCRYDYPTSKSPENWVIYYSQSGLEVEIKIKGRDDLHGLQTVMWPAALDLVEALMRAHGDRDLGVDAKVSVACYDQI